MINVLLPSMGESTFYKDCFFPKPMYEIAGRTMLELVMENYQELESKQFIFVFKTDDCVRFHLDSSAKLLAPTSRIIKLKNQTAGALCTCLMAIEYIDNDMPLIIANSDQIINVNYNDVIQMFRSQGDDGGVITFPSIHPRWSYAKKEGRSIVEVAEKRPLSKNAIAGFYYYEKGRDFVEAAKKTLKKQCDLDGNYYISSSMNEMILMGKKIGFYDISKNMYNSFYSPAKVKEYEESISDFKIIN